MLRSTLSALTMAATMTTSALAFDIDQMSDNERAIFRSEIRDYLMENPEVLMEAIQVLEQRRAEQAIEQEKQLLAANHDAIFDDGYSFVGGNPDGDVTMVEFLDYRCGFCKRAFPAVEELIASDGNIRFVVKEFPILGEASTLASRYAIATKMLAGDEVYKQLHDKLMTWNGDINEAALSRVSSGLDLDHEAVLAKMNDDDVTEIIRKNRALGNLLQIQGTPTFIVGEAFIRGFAELEQMRQIVRLVRDEQG
jgi:protein-disulfide isomerase